METPNKSISDLERLIEVHKRIEALRDEYSKVEEALLLVDEERLLWQKLSQPVLVPYPVPYYPVTAYPPYPYQPWIVTKTTTGTEVIEDISWRSGITTTDGRKAW